MEEYVKALEVETRERASLISFLEQADLFYEAQRGEFKVVCTVTSQLVFFYCPLWFSIESFLICIFLRCTNVL
jgi:hypothetical protein